MIIFPFGEYLKHERKSRKISQGEVSKGLCSVSSLSRIESGKQLPSRKLSVALFSRMGLYLDEKLILMTNIEHRRWQLEREIANKYCDNNFEFKNLLDEYENLGEMEHLEKQHFLFLSFLYESKHNVPLEILLQKLFSILEMTVEDFSFDLQLHEKYLTNIEILLLNNIALLSYDLGKKEEAMNLMKNLLEYYRRKPTEKREYLRNVPLLIFNLTNWLGLAGLYEEGLKLSEEGIELCKKEKLLQWFPKLIFNKGYCLFFLGKKEEAEIIMNEACILINSMNLHDEVLTVIPEIKRILGFDVWKRVELDN